MRSGRGRLASLGPSKESRFHAKRASRRSPEKGFGLWAELAAALGKRAAQAEEVVAVRRRKRAGMVKRTMKKRVVHRLDWEGVTIFLGLPAAAAAVAVAKAMLGWRPNDQKEAKEEVGAMALECEWEGLSWRDLEGR